MAHYCWLAATLLFWPALSVAQQAQDPLCLSLQTFLDSVQPGQVHEVAFHTVWGSNFNDSQEPAVFAKRCKHDGYQPAKPVCESLMATGVIEFAGNNAKRVVACLSSETHLAQRLNLNSASFFLSYGKEDQGSSVTVQFTEDLQLGGKVLRISANGY